MSNNLLSSVDTIDVGMATQLTSPGTITKLLLDWQAGDATALEKLMPLIYDNLRKVAQNSLNQWQNSEIPRRLQATEVVHEAYVRLIDQQHVNWQCRVQFFAIAAREIRRILVDEYRRNQSQKRGGGVVDAPLLADILVTTSDNLDLLALNEALEEMMRLDPRQARIVELHFFSGHTCADIAKMEQMGLSSVERELTHAKRWLKNKLQSTL
jgi:RNA polymerase sigma factor (TIGR02999 family)